MSKNRKIIVFIYRGLFSNARPRPRGERTMKETKRLYLALLVLAAGFFWCMCAGLFWPAQAEEDSDKGAWAASPLDTVKFSNLSDEDFQFNSKSQLYYAKAFSTLSDAEYSDVIGNLVMSTDDA